MNKDNLIVIDDEGYVGFIGINNYKFVSYEKDVLCYPAGSLEFGDIFVAISLKSDDFTFIEDFFNVKLHEKKTKRCGIYVGQVGRNDSLVVEKVDFDLSADVLIDIVFNKIHIIVSRNEDVIEVCLNKQRVTFDTYDVQQSIIVINDVRIKYYECVKSDIEKKVRECIVNGRFQAKSYVDQYMKLKLKDIIDKSLYDAFLKGKRNLIFDYEAYTLSEDKINIDNKEYTFYMIESIETILDALIGINEKYESLSREKYESGYKNLQYNSFRLWGSDASLAQTERLLQKGSQTNVTMLLTGESGTGKTFLAKEIHNASKRRNQQFIHVNCAAIPYNLIESELFGYEEGAFSGARKGGKKGFFDLAYGGTLFLDEISEIPMHLQGKLLEVMQNKSFFPIGGTQKHTVDVRLIVATNRNLSEMVREGEFRQDLFYRINVFPIEIPPLRRRMDVIWALINDILPDLCIRLGVEPVQIDYMAIEKIKKYSWPGNIRELENVIEKAIILSDGRIIMKEDILLPEEATFNDAECTLRDLKVAEEKRVISEALKLFNGDKNKAANYLGISRSTIFDKIKKYSIT